MWVLALTASTQVSYGQKWKEWFKQRKTQIEYLVNQIAALKVYTDYLEKGYSIVKDGTQLIGNIKQGDFNLHQGYFSSLQSINPAIRNYSRVALIISDQATILNNFKELLKFSAENGQFSINERGYITSVYDRVKTECLKDMDDLVMVLSSGEMEMKDNERLAFIDRIYADTKEKVTFTFSFCGQAGALAYQRTREARETFLLRKLYGQ